MAENESRNPHPLDPDPPRPPGVPDMDLDIPVGTDEAARSPGTEDTNGNEEAPEPPD